MNLMENTNLMYLNGENSGISGDIFLSAISQIYGDNTIFERLINKIKGEFSKVEIETAKFIDVNRNQIFPRKLDLVYHDHRKHHHINEKKHNEDLPHTHDKHKAHYYDIKAMKSKMNKILGDMVVSEDGVDFANSMFDILIEAEASVHKTSREKVHLHEIGSIDTVIDISGIALYLDKLEILSRSKNKKTQIYCSPIAVGGGSITIQHGTFPVPPPATSRILEKYKIPIRGGPVNKELCTPTGSAIIGALIEKCNLRFIERLPSMVIVKKVLSTGNFFEKDFPNIFEIYLGNELKSDYDNPPKIDIPHDNEDVVMLETTVDDIPGEKIGFMMDSLLEKGALDVNFINTQSKKNRPATTIRVVTDIKNRDQLIKLLITNLGTLGVRYRTEKRICLERKIITIETNLFNEKVKYRVKIAGDISDLNKITHYKIEHDDIERIARHYNKSIIEIQDSLEKDFAVYRKTNIK
ncbi:MAG: DUF111 family protein [Candidatus Lokiarchaeota archaeon]|nr:DUF111 family protein [Candidatus Lokiarchaeota archaeon]